MLKAACLNYIRYIKSFLKCFGIIAIAIFIFFLVFEISIMLPIEKESVTSYNKFLIGMTNYINTLNTDQMFESGFVTEVIKQAFTIFKNTNSSITIGTILVLLSIVIIVGAYFYAQMTCKKTIRKDLKNRDTVDSKTQTICKVVLSAVFWVLIFIVTLNWLWAIFLLPLVIACFNAVKVLITTWYIYFKKYKLKKFITPGNIFKLILTNAIFLYLHTMLFVFLAPITSLYFLILLALSFLAYTTCITEFTATKYFIAKRASRELSKK